MEKKLEDKIEHDYEGYLFMGIPKNKRGFTEADGEIVDFAISADQSKASEAIYRLGLMSTDFKFFFLKAALSAFEYADNDEWESFLYAFKAAKRKRYQNFGIYSQTPTTQQHIVESLAKKGKKV